MGRFLECCCTSLFEAMEAEAGGASRVELCENLPIGGITPSMDFVLRAVKALSIPVNVLIRPRGGDFVFSEEEVQMMLSSIRECKAIGVNAVVIGALTESGDVDIPVMKRLIEEARPLEVTFHRAFDESADPIRAYKDIVSLGCDRLLTSGHEASAYDGRFLIGELVKMGGCTILAGCGVRPENIAKIEKDSAAVEFHSSSHGATGQTERETVLQLVNNIL
ncbi:MAG: copper homeostasis protein CutC [Bacteroidales bacterium]|nr:copper homeostasis protein CutC [Bacteroidales bacterium]